MSANWITRNQDPESIAMDAICLAEAAWWGTGKKAYQHWDHGIYQWRQLCLNVAPWLHSAWQKANELQGGEDSVCFDSEFCEAVGTWLLYRNSDDFNPYSLQQFVQESYSDAEQRLRDLCADPDSTSDDIREAIGRFLEECK